MIRQRRRLIGFIGLVVGVVAAFLVIFGLYVRFSGTGNPAGSIYIIVGCLVAIGGAIPMWFVSWQRKDKPKL